MTWMSSSTSVSVSKVLAIEWAVVSFQSNM
jgi:hypothetical protein